MKKILVVDDSSTVRQQLRLALTRGGYQVIEAPDGPECFHQLARQPISLVICDVNMPDMNGFEVVARVKSDPRHAPVPIVMLTSEAKPELIEQARKAGTRGWIVKPFKAEALLATVLKLIGN